MRISHFTMLALILGVQAGMLDHKAVAQDLDGVVFVDDIETATQRQSSGPALPSLRSAPASVNREMLTASQAGYIEASEPAAPARQPLLGNPFGWLKRDTQQTAPPQQAQAYAQQNTQAGSRVIRDNAVQPASAHTQRRPGQGFQTRDTRNEHKTGILSGMFGPSSGSRTASNSAPAVPQAPRTAMASPNRSQRPATTRTATAPQPMGRPASLGNPLAMSRPLPMEESTGLEEPNGVAWVDDEAIDGAIVEVADESMPAAPLAIVASPPVDTSPVAMPQAPTPRQPAAGSIFAKHAPKVQVSQDQPMAVTNPHAAKAPKPSTQPSVHPAAAAKNMPLPMQTSTHTMTVASEAPLPAQHAAPVQRMPVQKVAPAARPVTQPETRVVAVENPVAPAPTAEAKPSPRAASLLVEANSIAQSASTEEEYSQIIQMCRHVLAIDSTQSAVAYSKNLASWALNRRGELKADAGRESEAGLDFDDAIRFDTASWRAIHNRGVLKAQQGDFAGANADFNQTIELNPKFAKAYSNRAALAVQDGKLAQACDDYQVAIQLDPDLAIAHKGRGRVCHLLGHLDLALQHLEAAAMLAPGDPHIANSRADLLMDMGRYHEAVEGYRTAISIDANMAESHRDLAWLLSTCPASDCRNAQQALASIERAVAITGADDDLSLDTLAAAKANAGDFVAAVETEQRAIALADESQKPAYESRLQLYQQQQPYRTEPASDVQQATFVE